MARPRPPQNEYVGSLLHELRASAPETEGRRVTSIYFGGGTPSLFTPDAVEQVLRAVEKAFPTLPAMEVTLEANPCTITAASLRGYRNSGVNRLSLGVQSLRDDRLRVLGRLHSAVQAREAFIMSREAGFMNISADFIFGTPGQSLDDWGEECEEAVALRPEHISLYELDVDSKTPLAERVRKGSLLFPDEDTLIAMHRSAWRVLAEGGYEHYEVSNFSLEGFRSKHNDNYWARGEYLGLGAGAHTFLSNNGGWGIRRWNTGDAGEYMGSIMEREGPCAGWETLTREQAMLETLFLGLRRTDGMVLHGFEKIFGVPVGDAFSGIRDAVQGGFMATDGERIFFTDTGLLTANKVMESLSY